MAIGTLNETSQNELNLLRKQIDALDKQLITLLKERIGIVHQVGELKSKDGNLTCFIRSGREADMLRDIYTEFKGSDFHPLAACSMWRQIISASTQHESPMEILTSAALQPYAQDYFGHFMPIKNSQTSQESIVALNQNPSSLMILPLWQDNLGYWKEFARHAPDSLKVFAVIPFVGGAPKAYVAANLTPEPSRDDISLFIDENGAISEIKGDYNSVVASDADIDHKKWLGTYAKPINR